VADIGLAPTHHDAFTDVSLSTKIFEYAAMGKPVVASALPLVERMFPDGAVTTYAPGSADALADAVVVLIDDPRRREAAVVRAAAIASAESWERHAVEYVDLVDRLVMRRTVDPAEGRAR